MPALRADFAFSKRSPQLGDLSLQRAQTRGDALVLRATLGRCRSLEGVECLSRYLGLEGTVVVLVKFARMVVVFDIPQREQGHPLPVRHIGILRFRRPERCLPTHQQGLKDQGHRNECDHHHPKKDHGVDSSATTLAGRAGATMTLA